MALETSKDSVMSAISTMGYEVFRNGQFHFNSNETPDMLINDDGSIHCWTESPFKGKNHGDLIDFILIADATINNFFEAKRKAYELINMPLPSIESYKDNGYVVSSSSEKKSGFITNDFISIFLQERKENFTRYMELLKQALPSCDFKTQKLLAERFEIGYSKQADRLIMPMRDENDNCVTLWKYNKNPKSYTNEEGKEIKPSKVTFTKGRERVPFNLKNLIKYREDKSKWIVLCAGEKDTLNALGNGYRAVTLGAENVLVPELYLPLFKGLKILIAYDWDKAGKKGATKVYEQLKNVALEVAIFDWEVKAKQYNIKLFDGFDFTDYLVGKKK